MADDTRIDRWLCAVRLVKTRPIATQLPRAADRAVGHLFARGPHAPDVEPADLAIRKVRYRLFVAQRATIVPFMPASACPGIAQ
jgi:hypothetical protein